MGRVLVRVFRHRGVGEGWGLRGHSSPGDSQGWLWKLIRPVWGKEPHGVSGHVPQGGMDGLGRAGTRPRLVGGG